VVLISTMIVREESLTNPPPPTSGIDEDTVYAEFACEYGVQGLYTLTSIRHTLWTCWNYYGLPRPLERRAKALEEEMRRFTDGPLWVRYKKGE
jgi:hypothetical protein